MTINEQQPHYRTLGTYAGEPAIPEPTPRDQLIDAYWAGDMGDVEFAELALGLGMEAHEIGQVMSDVRTEDGIDQ
jgi:hypothetical protein